MTHTQRLREALEYIATHDSSDWPERCREMVRRARAALAEADAGQGPTERWVVVRESVLDVGLGDDVRTGGRPELGYALISNAATFGTRSEAIAALKEAGLPIGWVVMPLARLLPDLAYTSPPAPAPLVPLTEKEVFAALRADGFPHLREQSAAVAVQRALAAKNGLTLGEAS